MESLFRVVEDKANLLFKLDEEIRESWLCKDESEDEVYQKDYEDAETCRDEYIVITTRNDKSYPSPVPWVTWEVVTGVEVIPCRGLLRYTLANGAVVYPSQGGRYQAEDCMALG
jgi:hypothetical protein